MTDSPNRCTEKCPNCGAQCLLTDPHSPNPQSPHLVHCGCGPW